MNGISFNDSSAKISEYDSISFWEWRIQCLENCLRYFVRKAGWSLKDIVEVEQIDDSLEEAYEKLDSLQET